MCEECENPAAAHLSYNEKRKRINATWQPARKTGRPFVAMKLSDPAPAREPDASAKRRD
jgi:uncharacterized protein (DUF736 family)